MKILKKIKKLPTNKLNCKMLWKFSELSDKIQKKPGLLYCKMFFLKF